MPEDGAPAGAEGDSPRARSIFLHLDRTWTLVWLFDGPLPSAARDGAQKYDRAALVEGHLDAFPTPSAVAGKALYPRMLLLLAAHGEARVLSAMLTLFGRPARGFDEPGSTTRHWLRLGSGLEVEPKGGPWWRYALASDGPGPEVADVMREHRGMLVPFVEEEELPGWGGPGAAGPAWADDSDSEAENAGQEQPGGVPVVVEVDGDEEGWEEALAAAVAVPGTGDQEE
ncbi:hypothetical protein DFJ74DRAFT_665312 [Hyaloraphidium curvatum]|nr:hypothetical protein DFJ74DRAFT_665312 [Hyaloraphidium curvatum]